MNTTIDKTDKISNCMPKVAVVMSVYKLDKLDYLQQAMDSVIQQTYSNIYVYIYVDGKVPDDINDYLDFIANMENVFLIKSEKNCGLAKALNVLIDTLLEKDCYSYVARMDSDDICRFNRIETQVDFLQQNPEIDVCGSFCREFGASFALEEKALPTKHNALLDFSITRCPFIHPTVMFKTDIFKDGVRYPEKTKLTEDMALWFILLNKGYVFANIDQILLDYRLNENTLNRRHGIDKGINELKIRLNYMFKLHRVSLKNFILIFARLVFHIIPISIMKKLYAMAR